MSRKMTLERTIKNGAAHFGHAFYGCRPATIVVRNEPGLQPAAGPGG